MPAPEARSSTACANAVAITGRWAVTASMSTPEVTCSRESYGRITTSADAASELERVDVEVAGLERHHVRDAQGAGAGDEPVAVRLAVALEHLRMGLTHHQVVGSRDEVPQRWERVDDPLDALAGSEQTPRQHQRTSPIRSLGTAVGTRRAAPCGITTTLASSTS